MWVTPDQNNFVYENFAPSFANESHISSQTVEHQKLLSEIVLTQTRNESTLEQMVSTILFYGK